MLDYEGVVKNKAEQFSEMRTMVLIDISENKPYKTNLSSLITCTKRKLRAKLTKINRSHESILNRWDLIDLLSIDVEEQAAVTKTLATYI